MHDSLVPTADGQRIAARFFDYRGTGLSRPRALRGFEADIFDWARLDCAAMIEALRERPLYWIGHSLGGQILGLVPNKNSVKKAVTVATGSGYWRENTAGIRPKAWWLWFVVTPLALPLWGYFPGKALRKVGDLPKGVMAQWSARNTEPIHGFYTGAPRIGPFGFFRSVFEASLWQAHLLPELA